MGLGFGLPTYTKPLFWRVLGVILLVVLAASGAVPILSTRIWLDFGFKLIVDLDQESTQSNVDSQITV
jgi:hypothetical protein